MLVRILVGAFVAGAALGANGRPAHAATAIGVDVDGAIPIDTKGRVNGGGGFGVRVGESFRLPFLRLTPEIGYAYAHLFADRAPSDWTTHRVLVGARVSVGELLVPFAFVHVGYGWRSTPDSSYGGEGAALDAGIGLDIALPIIAFGAHVGFAGIAAQPVPPIWVILGLDATLVF